MRTFRQAWIWSIVIGTLAWTPLADRASAQMVGARAGAEWMRAGQGLPPNGMAGPLDHQAVENYITIQGTVQKRLDPTAIRIVLALMVDGETPSECEGLCRQREDDFLQALDGLGIERDSIVVDFISILPIYEWLLETREGKSMAVETKIGFRMQSNVHIQVAGDEEARTALRVAFEQDIADVIAFDYWNEEVDRYKKEARREALSVAQEKADLLLGALFSEAPRPINVYESTQVVYPRSLYESFENTYADEVSIPYFLGNHILRLRAAKPKNTYFRGLMENTDVQDQGLPLRPQISVVSTVRLYYATPTAGKDDQPDDE